MTKSTEIISESDITMLAEQCCDEFAGRRRALAGLTDEGRQAWTKLARFLWARGARPEKLRLPGPSTVIFLIEDEAPRVGDGEATPATTGDLAALPAPGASTANMSGRKQAALLGVCRDLGGRAPTQVLEDQAAPVAEPIDQREVLALVAEMGDADDAASCQLLTLALMRDREHPAVAVATKFAAGLVRARRVVGGS